MRVADIALYWAKGEGKNRVCVYRPDMPAVTQLRRLTRAPDRAARLQAAAALASAVDARDAFEGSHSTRVGDLAAGIAARLHLPEEEIELIRLAGRLHDIGKLAVPEEILRKPGPLTRREKDVLESHPSGRPRDAAAARHRAGAVVGAAPSRALGRHRRSVAARR